jgi:DNA invertase Pin-like site-specific DNA recombinase
MGATKETIYFEYESGAKTDRDELEKLFNVIGMGDIVFSIQNGLTKQL